MSGATGLATSSLGELKQVDAGVLEVGYVDVGPANGRAVILLHGWPYDVHSDAEVAPPLASAGYRLIVPYLRGYGTTRFLSRETVRNGQQSVLAVDTIALMDALEIEQPILAGFDGGRGRPTSRSPLAAALQGARVRGPLHAPGAATRARNVVGLVFVAAFARRRVSA